MLSGFDIVEKTTGWQQGQLVRAVERATGRPVLLKFPANCHSLLANARLEREFHLLRSIRSPYVVTPVGFLNAVDGRPVMVLEDIGGCDFHQAPFWGQPLDVKEFLDIAIKIAQGIAAMHRAGIIHKNLCPRSIFYNRELREVRIIDFSLATLHEANEAVGGAQLLLESSLPYISPEQTGRMNRALDFRSDFYSFGALLYELATGKTMFDEADAISYVAAHISKQPTPVKELVAEIPSVISDMIEILTQKHAENRYQSAAGFIYDLRLAQISMAREGSSFAFALRTKDVSERFAIVQKLFGRQPQLDLLVDRFSAAASGDKLIVVVHGPEGIGKSALVHEMQRNITAFHGFFATGRFDQGADNVPFSGLAQALGHAIDQAMGQSPDDFAHLKKRVDKHLQGNGAVIDNLTKRIRSVIGEPLALPELGPAETHMRTLNTLVDFIAAMADADHPLVMFLDDMQWADAPTIELIEGLFERHKISHFMLILAYRDTDVTGEHPLAVSLKRLGGMTNVTMQGLTELEECDIRRLVAETLKREDKEASELSAVLRRQTGGNPFYLAQALKNLYDNKVIHFDLAQGGWVWNVQEIKRLGASSNIVVSLLERIRLLPEDALTTLKVAACLGSQFSLVTLALALDKSLVATLEALAALIATDLIMPFDANYQLMPYLKSADFAASREIDTVFVFQHDRIQQTAYSLWKNEKRMARHLFIAEALRANQDHINIDAMEIVRHFNEAEPIIIDATARTSIARLNMAMASRARATTALGAAKTYLAMAQKFLPVDPWNSAGDLKYEITLAAAETAFQLGEIATGEACIAEILDCVSDWQKRIETMTKKCLHEHNVGRVAESIDTVLKTLKLLGYQIPRHPTKLHVGVLILKARIIQGRRTAAELLGMRELTDFNQKMAIVNLHLIAQSSYIFGEENLYAIGMILPMLINMRYGLSQESVLTFGSYGAALGGAFGLMKEWREFHLAGESLFASTTDLPTKSKGLMGIACIGALWHEDHRNQKKRIEDSLQLAYQLGDAFDYAASALNYPYCLHDSDFVEIGEINEKMLQILENSKIPAFIATGRMQRGRIANFLGHTASTYSYTYGGVHEGRQRKLFLAQRNFNGYAGHCATKVEMLVMREKWRQAVLYASHASRHLTAILATRYELNLRFYKILALIQWVRHERFALRPLRHFQIFMQWRVIQRWYRHSPEAFAHFHSLIRAELLAYYGGRRRQVEALQTFERAVQEAGAYARLQVAVASQRLALFAGQRGLLRLQRQYLHKALFHYEEMRAEGVARFLRNKYPTLAEGSAAPVTSQQNAMPNQTAADERSPAEEALQGMPTGNLLEAYQAINHETQWEGLVRQVLTRLKEGTQATRVVLIADDDNDHYLVRAQIDDEGFAVMATPLAAAAGLSHEMMTHVLRTQKRFLIADVVGDSPFASDAEIRRLKIKSLLVVPLLYKHKVLGLLYLESSRTTHAFPPASCRLTELLAVGVAIAFERTRLYRSLDAQVKERSRAIQSVLENIELGLVTLYGNGFLIQEGYSSYLETILGQSELTGRSIFDVLFDHTEMSMEKRGELKNRLLFALDMDEISFSVNRHGLPREVVYHQGGREQILSLEWGTILGNDALIDKYVLLIRDITDEASLQKTFSCEDRELSVVSLLMDIRGEKLRNFFATARLVLRDCRRLREQRGGGEVRNVFLRIHSLKGLAASLSFTELSDKLNLMEQICDDDLKSIKRFDDASFDQHLNQLAELLEEYRSVAVDRLGRRLDFDTASQMNNLEQLLLDFMQKNTGDFADFVERALSMLFSGVGDLVRAEVEDLAVRAERLGKAMPEVVIVGSLFAVPRAASEPLRSILRRLFDYSLQRSIEPSDERERVGKSATGRITITCRLVRAQGEISYVDDGGGAGLPEDFGVMQATSGEFGGEIVVAPLRAGGATEFCINLPEDWVLETDLPTLRAG